MTHGELKDKWYTKGAEVGKLAKQGVAVICTDVVTEFDDEDFKENNNELAMRNRELWEQTDHFVVHYGGPMMRDAKALIEEKNEEGKFGELRIEYWQDFKEEFWDGYEQESDIYEALEEERKARKEKENES